MIAIPSPMVAKKVGITHRGVLFFFGGVWTLGGLRRRPFFFRFDFDSGISVTSPGPLGSDDMLADLLCEGSSSSMPTPTTSA